MKEYRSAGGERRLWFEPSEIEEIMADELRRSGRFPNALEPVVDLEAFLETGLGAKLDLYAHLEPEVLGVTKFIRNERPLVSISSDLTKAVDSAGGPPGTPGRWRATLAHEATHVVLHRMLFEVPPEQGELFDSGFDSRPGLLRCLKRDVVFGSRNNDWKEVQANMGMAALLMPSDVFSDVVRVVIGAKTNEGLMTRIPDDNSSEHRDLVVELSHRLEVSQQAAGIRLETLGLKRRATESMPRDTSAD